jgi:fatty acid synthase
LEGGSLTVTGSVKLLNENNAQIQIEHPSMVSENMILKSDDFYKELRLRGYQYKDAFLGFIEANSEGEEF